MIQKTNNKQSDYMRLFFTGNRLLILMWAVFLVMMPQQGNTAYTSVRDDVELPNYCVQAGGERECVSVNPFSYTYDWIFYNVGGYKLTSLDAVLAHIEERVAWKYDACSIEVTDVPWDFSRELTHTGLSRTFADFDDAFGGAFVLSAQKNIHVYVVTQNDIREPCGITMSFGPLYPERPADYGDTGGPLIEMYRVGNVTCPEGYTIGKPDAVCWRAGSTVSADENIGESCGVGNPINPTVGNKYQVETDYKSSKQGVFRFRRFFNSLTETGSTEPLAAPSQLGKGWRHSFSRSITYQDSLTVDGATLYRDDGRVVRFLKHLATYLSSNDSGILEQLQDADLQHAGWKYTAVDNSVEEYDAAGRLTRLTDPSGIVTTFQYNENKQLSRIENGLGDSLELAYDGQGRLEVLTDQSGSAWIYSYDANDHLAQVLYPDKTPADTTDNPRRQYHYEDPNFPHALTGLTDENGIRYATWAYDAQGRAISSEHAGGADKTTLDYAYLDDATDPRVIVTNPLGKQTTYHLTTIHGVRKVTQVEGHPTASCAGANKAYQYDANGNVISKTDWNGVTTTYTYDMDRNLELSRTEAAGTPEARTITTEWHPQFRLPIRVTEPNKITEYSYSPQGQLLNRHEQTIQ